MSRGDAPGFGDQTRFWAPGPALAIRMEMRMVADSTAVVEQKAPAPAQAPPEQAAPEQKPRELPDSGLSALAMVASYHQITCEPAQVRHELGIGARASTALDITRGARFLKLKSDYVWSRDIWRSAFSGFQAVEELFVEHETATGLLDYISREARDSVLFPALSLPSTMLLGCGRLRLPLPPPLLLLRLRLLLLCCC